MLTNPVSMLGGRAVASVNQYYIILANAKPSINKAGSNDKRTSSGDNRRNKDKNNRNHFSKVKNVTIGI